MRDVTAAPARSVGFFAALGPRGKAAFFALAAVAICLLFAFPVFWLILTSLRPASGVYYVHRGTEFTVDNFHDVLSQEIVQTMSKVRNASIARITMQTTMTGRNIGSVM